jgi:hypothetical protein
VKSLLLALFTKPPNAFVKGSKIALNLKDKTMEAPLMRRVASTN